MADLLLGISGRVEVGEVLTAVTTVAGSPVQWQAFISGNWVNVGSAGSLTYTIPPSGNGVSYRVTSTSGGATTTSAATSAATLDRNKFTAPTLAGTDTIKAVLEGGTLNGLFSQYTFADSDKENYTAGSLTVLNSNAAASGGDGNDLLSIQFGTGSGQFSYNAATREVLYGFNAGAPTVVGQVDATANGAGSNLTILFNASATKAVVDLLIDRLRLSSNDDSPVETRLLTLRVTDPTGATAQRAMQVNVTPQADAPVFTGAATFTVDENQTAAGAVAATDPDREAGAPQGMSYSLAGGTGSADNALFSIDAASGALSFSSAPNFESTTHTAQYTVRVRASDTNGGTVEQVVTVNVSNVNEAPVAQALTGMANEAGPAITIAAAFADPDAADSHTVTFDAAGTVGNVTVNGQAFTYDAAGQFESLAQGQTTTDSFSYTVTDSGGLSSTRTATITVTGSNDAAFIDGTTSAAITDEANAPTWRFASGSLQVTDPDQGQALFVPQDGVHTTALGWGTFSIGADGNWDYVVESSHLRGLGATTYAVETFTVTSVDGTATRDVEVTLQGINDAPEFVGPPQSGSVVESGHLDNGDIDPGQPTASGTLRATDPDGLDSITFGGTATGTYGALAVDSATGAWTFTLDNSAWQTQALIEGQYPAYEMFVVSVTDSQGVTTQQPLLITIAGTNDAPVINGDLGASVPEPWANLGHVDLGIDPAGKHDVTVDAQGRILAFGDVDGVSTLTRYNADGSLDQAFGDNGSVAVASWGLGQVAVDPQGRIVLSGYHYTGYSSTWVDYAVQRLNEDGSVDTGFGTDGVALVDFGGGYDYGDNVMFGAGGKILVAGQAHYGASGELVLGIARLNADGGIDPSFGDAGRLVFMDDAWIDPNFEVTLDSEGRLLVWGRTTDSSYNNFVSVSRFLQDGTLDESFGAEGRATIASGSWYGGSVELLAGQDGRITLGWTQPDQPGRDAIYLARLTQDGALDSTFVGGILPTNLHTEYDNFVLATDDWGNTLVGYTAVDSWGDMGVARFHENGMRDFYFGGGSGGTVYANGARAPESLHVTPDGHVLIAGTGLWPTANTVVAALKMDGTTEWNFGDSPDFTLTGSLHAFDPDNYVVTWLAGTTQGEYGEFSYDANGQWTYALDGNAPGFRTLQSGETALETFTVSAMDLQGAVTTAEVVIEVHGNDDPTRITGQSTGHVYDTPGLPPPANLGISGVLTVDDPDEGEDFFMPVTNQTTWRGGTFSITAEGSWTYTADAQVLNALNEGVTELDRMAVTSMDGSVWREVKITLHGANDAPELWMGGYGEVRESGIGWNGLPEPGIPSFDGQLWAHDWDSGDTLTWSGTAAGAYGQFTIDSTTGAYTYALDNDAPATQALGPMNYPASEHFTVTVTDSHGGTAQQQVTINVIPANDAPVVGEGGDWAARIELSGGRSGQLSIQAGGSPGALAVGNGGDVYAVESSWPQDVLRHYDAEGNLDLPFGSNSQVSLGISTSDVAVDADGRVVLVGSAPGGGAYDFAVARFLADGSADPSFGQGGQVTIDFNNFYDFGYGLLFEDDGQMLVTGAVYSNGYSTYQLAAVQLNEDGSLDTSFGDGGRLLFDNALVNGSFQVALDSAGRMVAWGTSTYSGPTTVTVQRYLADGTLDSSFGTGGSTSFSTGPNFTGRPALDIGSDDSIVIGWAENGQGNGKLSVARLGDDGVLDASFADGGMLVRTDVASNPLLNLAIDGEGNVLVETTIEVDDSTQIQLARYDAFGTLDASFGDAGMAAEVPGSFHYPGKLLVRADGDVVSTGVQSFNGFTIIVERHNGDGSLDTSYGDPVEYIATGNVTATDTDAGDSVQWGSFNGDYGFLGIMANGDWDYHLNAESVAWLGAGQEVVDTITVRGTDQFGAYVERDIEITIVGGSGE